MCNGKAWALDIRTRWTVLISSLVSEIVGNFHSGQLSIRAAAAMGVMLHLQHSAPSPSQVAIGLILFGLVALLVDYARMLLLRSKMVGGVPTVL